MAERARQWQKRRKRVHTAVANLPSSSSSDNDDAWNVIEPDNKQNESENSESNKCNESQESGCENLNCLANDDADDNTFKQEKPPKLEESLAMYAIENN